MGSAYSVFHAAECFARRPPETSFGAERRGGMRFSQSDYILWEILRFVAREEIPFPWDAKAERNGNLPQFRHQTVEEYMEWYESKFRRDANG